MWLKRRDGQYNAGSCFPRYHGIICVLTLDASDHDLSHWPRPDDHEQADLRCRRQPTWKQHEPDEYDARHNDEKPHIVLHQLLGYAGLLYHQTHNGLQ